MEHSRFIHDYLDGELNESQKEALFAELARDAELRAEFERQLQMQIIAQNDMKSIALPIEATGSVFKALGFAVPSADYLNRLSGNQAVDKKTTALLSLKNMMKKRFAPLLLVALTFLTTASVFMVYNNYTSNQHDSQIANQGTKNNAPVVGSFESDNKGQQNLAATNNNQNGNNSLNRVNTPGDMLTSHSASGYGHSGNNSKGRYRQDDNGGDSYMYNNTRDNSDLAANSNNTRYTYPAEIIFAPTGKSVNESNQASGSLANTRLSEIRDRVKGTTSGFITGDALLALFDDVDNTTYSILLERKSITGTSPAPANIKLSNDPLSNIGLTFLYKLNRNHSIGISVGREQFPQQFYINNSQFLQRQNPDLFWYGATYRLMLPDYIWKDVLYPYAQGFAGATTVGPVIKGEAGLQFKPTRNFTILVGFEGGYLYYNVQGNILHTDKYGIKYSLGYSF